MWRWRVTPKQAVFIRIGVASPFVALAAWLLQNFLQLRGVVNLLASRIDLAFLTLAVLAVAWVITTGIPFRWRWRLGLGLVLIMTAIAVDRFTPKPSTVQQPITPTVTVASKPIPTPNTVSETTGTKDDIHVEVHHPQKDVVSVIANKPDDLQPRSSTSIKETPSYIRKTEPFYSYVLFNSYNESVPFACANSMNISRLGACAWIREGCKKEFHGDFNLVRSACALAIDQYIVALLQNGEDSGSETNPTPTTFLETPGTAINIPNPHQYELGKIVSEADAKKLPPDFLPSTVTLPTGTRLSLVHTLQGPAPESYVARLEQNGCFRVDFKVTPYGPKPQGQLPSGYELRTVPDFTSQLVAYPFMIQTVYSIERLAPISCNREDYERWITDFFAVVKMNIEN